METGGKELLQVQLVGINIPNPAWFDSIPPHPVSFGKHFATFKLENGWKLEGTCKGKFLFFQRGYEAILNPKDSIGIYCQECHLALPFSRESWQKTMLEWMIIASGTNLKRIQIKEFKGSTIFQDKIKVCKSDWIDPWLGMELEKNPDYIDWHVYGAYWDDYKMVSRIINLDEQGHNFLHVLDAILKTEIEKTLQKAIRRAAELACSASEPFHPDTRRNR